MVQYVHSPYAWPTLSFPIVSEAASPRQVNHFPLGVQGGALTVSGAGCFRPEAESSCALMNLISQELPQKVL